jgi:hypothetical protein
MTLNGVPTTAVTVVHEATCASRAPPPSWQSHVLESGSDDKLQFHPSTGLLSALLADTTALALRPRDPDTLPNLVNAVGDASLAQSPTSTTKTDRSACTEPDKHDQDRSECVATLARKLRSDGHITLAH